MDYRKSRKRFTRAHELAHYYLGHLDGQQDEYTTALRTYINQEQNKKELDADKLAREILMTKDKFIESFNYFKSAGHDLEAIVRCQVNTFNVIQKQVEYRIEDLGLNNVK